LESTAALKLRHTHGKKVIRVFESLIFGVNGRGFESLTFWVNGGVIYHPQNQQSQPNATQTIEATRLVLFYPTV
jgi:hypothetical protein